MFGRQPNLPIDLAFRLNPEGRKKVTHDDYVKKLKENVQENYKLAVEDSEKTAQRNKQRYDLKVRVHPRERRPSPRQKCLFQK